MIRIGVRKTLLAAVLAAGLAASLQGCALLLVGAVGGGTMMAADRRTLGAQTEDREIQVKALDRLNHNLPDQTHIDVTVYNRRVLLTGEVPNEQIKRQAETIVRDLNNVNGIINELAIDGASSMSTRANDSYIVSKVKASLVQARDISANSFKVTVERGNVYLMGLVTRAEGDRGADIASRVRGVSRVVKVFQYIRPDDTKAIAPVTTVAPNPPPDTGANLGATVGAIPDSGVSSQPLDAQPPAPVSNSTVHPVNPHKPVK
jgi:osmotically-inducible protein OsmY